MKLQNSPRFIFVASFSLSHCAPSTEDWYLKIVFYDTKDKRLKASPIRFANRHVGGAWEKSHSTFTPLLKPECAGVEILNNEDCLFHKIQLFAALNLMSKSIQNNEKVEIPRHKVTGHFLIDQSYFDLEQEYLYV